MNAGYMVVVIVCYNIAFAFFLHDLVCSSTKLALAATATTTTTTAAATDVVEEESRACPTDSILASDGECRCSTEKCSIGPAVCLDGYIKRRIHEGTNEPGYCCDIDECLLENNGTNSSSKCDLSKCPKIEPCPSDSYPVGVTKSPDGCCSTHRGCQCLPKCEKPECPSGMVTVVELTATGEPGRCCPLYKCEKNVLTGSGDGGDGNQKNVEQAGCLTSQHGLVEHGFNWTTQDSCVTCICQDGVAYCVAPACKPCLKAVATPNRDQCCPVCEVPHVQLDHCPPMPNCSERCLYGNALDDEGCLTCRCNRKQCPRECVTSSDKTTPAGVIDDDRCICDDSVVAVCAPLVNCNLNCTFGYEKNENGCDICGCSQCTKKCSNGYVSKAKGSTSAICKCKPWKSRSNSVFNAVDANTNVGIPCKSDEENTWRDDGEVWFDGCRQCICISGEEMCSLLHCPPSTCSTPTFNSTFGCCPFCPDTGNDDAGEAVCLGPKGVVMQEGESLSLDECIRCTCHDGRALCRAKRCPPTPCRRIRPASKGECCGTCDDSVGEEEAESDLRAYLKYTKRCDFKQMNKNETVWREDICTSCHCENVTDLASIAVNDYRQLRPNTRCYTESCAEAGRLTLRKCNRSLTIKGNCCPICLYDKISINVNLDVNVYKETDNHPYTYDNVTYESDSLNKCIKCECEGGHVQCVNKICSPSCSKLDNVSCSSCSKHISSRGSLTMRNIGFVVLLLAFAPAAVITAVCITRHWRYRTQQISLRDFGRTSPHYQYVPTSPYDSTNSQKVLILSAEKKPMALV